jgi:site-specific DNA-methyltransferase (adenine-specific)
MTTTALAPVDDFEAELARITSLDEAAFQYQQGATLLEYLRRTKATDAERKRLTILLIQLVRRTAELLADLERQPAGRPPATSAAANGNRAHGEPYFSSAGNVVYRGPYFAGDADRNAQPGEAPGWTRQVRAAGLSLATAKRWQTLARVPEPVFRAAIEDARRTRSEVTLGSFLALGRQYRPANPPPPIAQLPAGVLLDTADARQLPLPDGSIDLFAFSPPFNVGMHYGLDARGQSVDDALPYDEYLELARRILVELHRVGTPRARLAINIPLDIRYGGEPRFIASNWHQLATAAGWHYQGQALWRKGNGTTAGHRARGPIASPACPIVITPVDVILFFSRAADWALVHHATSDLTVEEWTAWTDGDWQIAPAPRTPHCPAPWPEHLVERIVKLLTYPGDRVCDPTAGSGTTARVCRRLGRPVWCYDLVPAAIAEARALLASEAAT